MGDGRAHDALSRRADRRCAARRSGSPLPPKPDFVGFYRWHIPDPLFEREMRATIQQIGALMVPKGAEHLMEDWGGGITLAGNGWVTGGPISRIRRCMHSPSPSAWTTIARPHFVYAREPQSVPRLDVAAAIADIGRRDYERKSKSLVPASDGRAINVGGGG